MFTKYSIVITARNNKGDGPMSDPIVVQTKEGGLFGFLFLKLNYYFNFF